LYPIQELLVSGYVGGLLMPEYRYLLILAFLMLGMPCGERFGSVARAEDTPKEMLAAQIRTQGFTCERPQDATREPKLSRPDHEVWVLTCENATYRISRYPDRAADVEQLR
jgi:hypothetical protein